MPTVVSSGAPAGSHHSVAWGVVHGCAASVRTVIAEAGT